MLVTDLLISEMTGIELLADVKKKFPDTNVIMVNDYASGDNVLKVLNGEVLIVKPFARDKLQV